MQEMKLIDAYALDEVFSGRCAYNFDVDIARLLIANAPEIPAVPLDVHERMKREMNNEIICLKAEIEDLKIIKQNALEIISTGQKQMLEIRNNSIKEFAERLCEDRVSNDPVVIAVKVELKEMEGDAE